MGVAGVEGLSRRVDDVPGRVEVGLADLEVDDLAALRFECPRASEDLKRRLGTEARHAVGKGEGIGHGGDATAASLRGSSQTRGGREGDP